MTRAVSEDAKREKTEFIINQAFILFGNKSFREFKMDELAKRCNFSKGIIFKYFRTKEELFLSMLVKEYNFRLQNVINRLIDLPDHSINLEGIKPLLIQIMRDDLYQNINYIRLLLIKCSILEQNINYEFAKAFQSLVHDNFNIVLNLFARKIEFIGQEILRDVFTTMDSIVEGYLSKILKPYVINQVVENENLYQFQIDYKKHALNTYDYYLTTFINKNKRGY